MRALVFLVTSIAAIQLACQSSGGGRSTLPEPNPERAGELRPEELREGNRLYTVKCAKCHKFYNPGDYDRAEWHMWMTKMSRKAHLNADEQIRLARYLDLFRPVAAKQDSRRE